MTAISSALAVLLVLLIRAMLVATRAFAAYVSGWPLAVLLLLGVACSLIGVLVARQVDSRRVRHLGCFVNGSILTFHSVLLIGIAILFVGLRQERFIIPDSYMGDVYVVYNLPNGEPEKRTFWGVDYRIPKDGILLTQGAMKHQMVRSEYYYEHTDGSLTRIRGFWPTTIHPTQENLASNKDFGVFFPRSGTLSLFPTPPSSAPGCSVEYERVYVGTKSYLLTEYKQMDLSRYLSEHSVACRGPGN